MKTFLNIVIIIAFCFSGCVSQNTPAYKVVIVPESKSSVVTLNSMNKAADVITRRLNNSFGISSENLKISVSENQISITISKADTFKITSVREIITGYARLEFWETFENAQITGYLSKANNRLREMKSVTDLNNANAQNPLFGILKPRLTEHGDPLPSCMVGLAAGNDTATVNLYLHMAEIKALLPGDLKLMWSMKPYKYDSSKTFYELHALKVTTRDGKPPLDGSVIISAKTVTGRTESNVKIDLTMNAEGTTKWAGITRGNIDRCIAIVLNGYVRSYPRVQNEISGGETEITGDFTVTEANDLVNILKSGELPFKLKIAEEQIIKN